MKATTKKSQQNTQCSTNNGAEIWRCQVSFKALIQVNIFKINKATIRKTTEKRKENYWEKC